MATRLPASQRTREELTSLIEGRLSTSSAKDKLVKLATRLIAEEPLEGGRDEPFRSAIREHLKGHTQGLEDLATEQQSAGAPSKSPSSNAGR